LTRLFPAMKAGQGLGTANGLMAESSLGCLFMLSYSHRFPFPATSFSGPCKIGFKKA
jgi:hypothetical protein